MGILRKGGQLARVGGALGRANLGGGGGGETGERSLLTSADLTYLGMFKTPASVAGPPFATRLGFSDCHLTGRRVDASTLNLYITNARPWGGGIYEIRYPGTQSTTLNGSTPRASLQRIYSGSSIYSTKRNILDPSVDEFPVTHGIHYDGERLWWGYGAVYNGSPWNPSLGYSVLNHDGSGATTLGTVANVQGPWRFELHNGYCCGWMQNIPAWFREAYLPGGQTMVIGNPTRASNATSPFGADCIAFVPPTAATPPSTVGNTTPAITTTQKLLWHDLNHPQARNTNAMSCEGIGPGATQFLPEFAGGYNPSNLLDWMDSGCWIDTGTKHGIMYVGQLVDVVPGFTYASDGLPHNWYAAADTCSHGHVAAGKLSTGPGTDTLVNYMWFYDPMDLVDVINGDTDPWGVTPTETIRAHTIGNFCAERRTQLYRFGGMYFDNVTNRIFLAERDRVIGDEFEAQPVIHVFQVS